MKLDKLEHKIESLNLKFLETNGWRISPGGGWSKTDVAGSHSLMGALNAEKTLQRRERKDQLGLGTPLEDSPA